MNVFQLNGNPFQCSCLENHRDGGAWRAALYGIAQSRTRLKQLSSSSSIMLSMSFSKNDHCYVEIYSLYNNFDENFYHEWRLNLVSTTKKGFFCFCWDDHVIFILNFVNAVYCIDWSVNTEPSLLPWDQFHLHVVYDLFHILLNQFVDILLKIFHTHQGCWAVMIFFLSCGI